MSLEEKLRKLAAKGELVHLSLYPAGRGWECAYTPASVMGIARGSDGDPVKAIEAALDAAPAKAPRIRKPRKGEDHELTATVSDDAEHDVPEDPETEADYGKPTIPSDWMNP